jgi:hypothetical protein
MLCGGLLLVGAVGVGSSAGAAGPALAVTPSSLSFGEITLGTFTGPTTFTVTNNSSTPDTINVVDGISYSGVGADDYFVVAEDSCPGNGIDMVVLAPAQFCTFDNYFFPGALGERDATLHIADSADSGVAVPISGSGGIGYYQVSSAGIVANFGDAGFYGDLSNMSLNRPIVGITQTGDDGGYWLVGTDGGVFPFGDAQFYGSTGSLRLNKPIVGMAATQGGTGYWLVASDGGIFSYGDAQFFGSTGGIVLNKPIVGMARTFDGGGYWLVASDGGIFSYGDAQFFGSTGSMHLNKPIVGMAPTPDDGGYWLVASDGGIFAYGDAQFYGSTGAIRLNQPIVAMAPMPTGNGYWFTAADGGLFNYGDAPFQGAAAGQIGTVVGMATDGAPTAQAIVRAPAVRPRGAPGGGSARAAGLPSSAQRYAGP